MGRTEELREKIRRQQAARAPDPALVRFTDKINDAIADKGAYVYSSEGWVEQTFAAARGVPEAQWDAWIAEATRGLFLSTYAKPKWPGDDPTWCFHDNVPLTFVGQMPGDPDNPGKVLFIFTGCRQVETGDKTRDGLRQFYKMVVQGPSWRSHVYGLISH